MKFLFCIRVRPLKPNEINMSLISEFKFIIHESKSRFQLKKYGAGVEYYRFWWRYKSNAISFSKNNLASLFSGNQHRLQEKQLSTREDDALSFRVKRFGDFFQRNLTYCNRQQIEFNTPPRLVHLFRYKLN